MDITFIITIDPVKSLDYLNVCVHSLNMQTAHNFNVVFYNQTLIQSDQIFQGRPVIPQFEYTIHSVPPEKFLGKYPIWDLYGLHAQLLRENKVSDYIMALHMEEFLDSDYVEAVSKILSINKLDILLGNLTRTAIEIDTASELLDYKNAVSFQRALYFLGFNQFTHWAFVRNQILVWNLKDTKRNIMNAIGFGRTSRPKPTKRGYRTPPWYFAEDVYLIRSEFARKYNWFLEGYDLPFEDIHFCEVPGVSSLAKELKKITKFPCYFNRSKIYHLPHSKNYYQLQDPEFTRGMLALKTDVPVLQSLQKAIEMHQEGDLNMQEALDYSRRNPRLTGTQNCNYAYHMSCLRDLL